MMLMDLAAAPLRVVSAAKVPATRHKIRRLAEPLVGADRAGDVELMAAEAIANAWVHGTGPVDVTVTCTATALRVEVCDQGPGFAVARRVDHGRGLTIIAGLADRYELDRGDRRTRLWFEINLRSVDVPAPLPRSGASTVRGESAGPGAGFTGRSPAPHPRDGLGGASPASLGGR